MLEEPPAGADPGRPGAARSIVVLVDVRDPGNAGTVLRAADASGSALVVFAGDSVDPYNPKTVRSSAGSLFHVPLRGAAPTRVPLAAELAAAGFRTLATVVRDGEDYAGLDWSAPDGGVPRQRVLRASTPDCAGALSGALAIPMAGGPSR